MNLDYLHRLRIGFSLAVSVNHLAPCLTFGASGPINDLYADEPKSEGCPNPWHIGTLHAQRYPKPEELIQGELELLVFLYGLVIQMKPKLIVETGCNVGLTTRALAAAAWVNGFGHVVSSDIDEAMVVHAKMVCDGLPADIRHCPSLALPELRQADLVFIDSGYVSRSQEHYLVKPGAVYVYHDSYAEPWVRPEVEYEKYKVHIDTPRGFTIARKA